MASEVTLTIGADADDDADRLMLPVVDASISASTGVIDDDEAATADSAASADAGVDDISTSVDARDVDDGDDSERLMPCQCKAPRHDPL